MSAAKRAETIWNYYDGEPFLENPRLGIVNPRRRRRKGKRSQNKMAGKRRPRNRKGQFMKGGARRNAPRRTTRRPATKRKATRKRNPWPVGGAVVSANPRRRRSPMKRNPRILGITIPPMETMIYALGGFIATPIVEGFALQYLPANLTGNMLGRTALRAASTIGLGWAVKRFIGSSEGNSIMVGGAVYTGGMLAVEMGWLQAPAAGGMSAYAAIAGPTPIGPRALPPSRSNLREYVPADGQRSSLFRSNSTGFMPPAPYAAGGSGSD